MLHHNIILLGMAGVGKSTLGKLLSKKIGRDFIDLDQVIEEYFQEPLQSVLNRLGDQGFLDIEKQLFLTLAKQNTIIAPGGSFIYVLSHLPKAYNAIYIYLDEQSNILLERLNHIDSRGIVGIKNYSFEQLVEQRRRLGKEVSHLFLTCKNRPKDQLVNEIISWLVDQKKIKLSL